ncbi:rubrerythrin family protein [candidate division KSB1 bacterium]|nr:rubrerythrin family protein [candidate division KSB1 bacterium]
MRIDRQLQKKMLTFQRNEITEYHIYRRLARMARKKDNRDVLNQIAKDELSHSKVWKEYTQKNVKPAKLKIWFFVIVSRLLGYTFAIKLMERGEEEAENDYEKLADKVENIDSIIDEENKHEEMLIDMLEEERLQYAGSMVLGLNDALVELTGVLAGLTLALQNTQLIALSGLITGIAAALSMGASEYLSTKSEKTIKNPVKASVYTGTAYIITVILLILPYLVLENYYFCLAMTLFIAVLVIAFFNYYISVAKDESFKKRFWEMAILSLSVAAFSFLIGFVMRQFLGVDL